MTSNDWMVSCPVCRDSLGTLPEQGEIRCSQCGTVFPCVEGIWRFLPPNRLEYFQQFLRDYSCIRRAEGRGSDDPEYYRRLPTCGAGHPMAWQWQIRRRTFECFSRRVLPLLGRGVKILDVGAGVGWLSHRLDALGHRPCAVDLSNDDRDGLAAARHFAPTWPRIQAEFDRLPLEGGTADAVVYNASLHYSVDYCVTLREALRVLRPDGIIVVLESPIYHHEKSGREMASGRHRQFEKRFGTRSDTLPSLEYLTWKTLEALARDLQLEWRIIKPWYGWKWALRPWVARLKATREPSRFAILIGKRKV